MACSDDGRRSFWAWISLRRGLLAPTLLLLCAASGISAADTGGAVFDVRAFGARGDGKTLDTEAINKAIDAAAAKGGGTVLLPAGTYLSFSIRLKSHVTLFLGPGVTLVAAEPARGGGGTTRPSPTNGTCYQDFGHSHWQNSLIWGIGLEDVADPRSRSHRRPRAHASRAGALVGRKKTGDRPLSMGAAPPPPSDPEATARRFMDGQGNKAIALKLCRNVLLRDFSILNGGHFALLATGVDNLTIDNLKIDTNRDGLDIDACRNVRIIEHQRQLAQRRCHRPQELLRSG